MSFLCSEVLSKLPQSCFDKNGFLIFSGVLLTTESHEFATAALAGDDANYDQDIIDGKMIPLHGVQEVEDMSFVPEAYESPSGSKTKTLRSKYGVKLSFNLTTDQIAAIGNWTGKKARAIFYDQANNLMMTTPDGTIRKGWRVGYINIEDLTPVTDGTPAFTKIEFRFQNVAEMNEQLAVVNTQYGTAADRWAAYDLEPLAPVTITQVGTVTATDLVYDVASKSLRFTDVDGDPISDAASENLLVGNTLFTDGAGTVLTPSGVTESATVPGRYTAVFTAIAAGATAQIIPTITEHVSSDETALV